MNIDKIVIYLFMHRYLFSLLLLVAPNHVTAFSKADRLSLYTVNAGMHTFSVSVAMLTEIPKIVLIP